MPATSPVGSVPVQLALVATNHNGIEVATMEVELPVHVNMVGDDPASIRFVAGSFMPALSKAMRTWADEIDAEAKEH